MNNKSDKKLKLAPSAAKVMNVKTGLQAGRVIIIIISDGGTC